MGGGGGRESAQAKGMFQKNPKSFVLFSSISVPFHGRDGDVEEERADVIAVLRSLLLLLLLLLPRQHSLQRRTPLFTADQSHTHTHTPNENQRQIHMSP